MSASGRKRTLAGGCVADSSVRFRPEAVIESIFYPGDTGTSWFLMIARLRFIERSVGRPAGPWLWSARRSGIGGTQPRQRPLRTDQLGDWHDGDSDRMWDMLRGRGQVVRTPLEPPAVTTSKEYLKCDASGSPY